VTTKKHRSVSQLDGYYRCGEAYYLERIAKAPATPAAWLAQGIAVHAALEHWEKSARTATIPDCLNIFEDSWTGYTRPALEKADVGTWLTGGRTLGVTDFENRYARGQKQVEDYIFWAGAQKEMWRILTLPGGSPAIEIPFSIELSGVQIVGFIDQIIELRDGRIVVRDIKTGNKLPSSDRQLGIYKIAIQKELNIGVRFGDFYMCKNVDTTPQKDLTRYSESVVGGWFKALDDAIISEQFVPNPGDSCRICSVKNYCSIFGFDNSFAPKRGEKNV
jgi:hypothetical protein